ncbi:hypothetical protein CEXT_80311 [Caerostris extrusa]|uniref:Secreted protein n=1 Tax=Caerostris extrusa TaxID=172846 RepID=A0AAV4W4E9_CAEEX|nr:hypothetical protein CEXT_80311 [Caerostris extrusa]
MTCKEYALLWIFSSALFPNTLQFSGKINKDNNARGEGAKKKKKTAMKKAENCPNRKGRQQREARLCLLLQHLTDLMTFC